MLLKEILNTYSVLLSTSKNMFPLRIFAKRGKRGLFIFKMGTIWNF